MNITLSIDSEKPVQIKDSDIANIVVFLDDDTCYASFYSKLLSHPSSEVRAAIAGKTTLPFDRLMELTVDVSVEVVRQLACNTRALELFELPQFQKMINRDVSVAEYIADNLSSVSNGVREDVIKILLKHADPMVINTVEGYIKYLDEMVDDETL